MPSSKCAEEANAALCSFDLLKSDGLGSASVDQSSNAVRLRKQYLDARDRLDESVDKLDGEINLQEKIDRLTWCLNLFLLDGFDREELERLKREVDAFHARRRA
jgi:hypothetical protein